MLPLAPFLKHKNPDAFCVPLDPSAFFNRRFHPVFKPALTAGHQLF
jgi:hypothetical protein